MKFKIVVNEATPSLNVVNVWHWARKKAEKQRWYYMLFMEVGTSFKGCSFKNVKVTRYGPKMLDYDNLVGGMKSLVVDNLRVNKKSYGLGLINDDNPDEVTITYEQVSGKDARPYRTEIELW